MGHKGPGLKPRCIGPGRARTQIPIIHSFTQGVLFLRGRYLDLRRTKKKKKSKESVYCKISELCILHQNVRTKQSGGKLLPHSDFGGEGGAFLGETSRRIQRDGLGMWGVWVRRGGCIGCWCAKRREGTAGET